MKTIDKFILIIFISPLVLIFFVMALIITDSIFSAAALKLSFFTKSEQYTSLVPQYLKASKPRLLADTRNFLGGGFIAIEMQIEPDAAYKMIKEYKNLIGEWEPTPISHDQVLANKKAEFLQFVRSGNCSGCSAISDAASHQGNYYSALRWPLTGRVGILVVPASRKLYYVESGN